MHASSFGSQHRDGTIRAVSETNGIIAVSLEGEFDLTTAEACGAEIDRALESGDNLILDLSEATFIDSSIIHVLVKAAKTAGERERAMALQLGTAAAVERALEIANIEQVLPRAHDRAEAVRMIQQQSEAKAE